MALMDWKDEYSVSVASIDAQHKKLFDMVNELYEAMRSGTGSKVAPEILNRLVAYTKEHFASEETFMIRAGYSDFVAHKAEHDKLTAEVVTFVKNFESGQVAISVQLLEFLRGWLQNHIIHSDKKYSGSLNAAGVK